MLQSAIASSLSSLFPSENLPERSRRMPDSPFRRPRATGRPKKETFEEIISLDPEKFKEQFLNCLETITEVDESPKKSKWKMFQRYLRRVRNWFVWFDFVFFFVDFNVLCLHQDKMEINWINSLWWTIDDDFCKDTWNMWCTLMYLSSLSVFFCKFIKFSMIWD